MTQVVDRVNRSGISLLPKSYGFVLLCIYLFRPLLFAPLPVLCSRVSSTLPLHCSRACTREQGSLLQCVMTPGDKWMPKSIDDIAAACLEQVHHAGPLHSVCV